MDHKSVKVLIEAKKYNRKFRCEVFKKKVERKVVFCGNYRSTEESLYEVPYFDYYTPLIFCIDRGFMDLIFELISNPDVDINICDSRGNTPLHHAARKGFYNVAVALVNRGADRNARNRIHELPFELCENSHTLREYLKN